MPWGWSTARRYHQICTETALFFMLSPSGLPGWWIGTKARDFYGALQTKKVLQKKNCPRLRETRKWITQPGKHFLEQRAEPNRRDDFRRAGVIGGCGSFFLLRLSLSCLSDSHSSLYQCRVVQQDFMPEIDVFCILSQRGTLLKKDIS